MMFEEKDLVLFREDGKEDGVKARVIGKCMSERKNTTQEYIIRLLDCKGVKLITAKPEELTKINN